MPIKEKAIAEIILLSQYELIFQTEFDLRIQHIHMSIVDLQIYYDENENISFLFRPIFFIKMRTYI